MELNQLSYFFIAILAAIIGAAPFGLVNLTVIKTTLTRGSREAMRISLGATVVEIVFGLFALLAGSLLQILIDDSLLIHFIIIGILLLAGGYYLFSKAKTESSKKLEGKGFLLGIFLNLISIQVLLYWVFAIGFLITRFNFQIDVVTGVLYSLGIGVGKMVVLWLYSYLSKKIAAKSKFISGNVNRTIGFILLFTAILQFVKI